MGKILFDTATTINGWIADEQNSLAWLFAVENGTQPDEGLFPAGATVLVEGSTTYEWVLAESDILSLIVFNTSADQLSAAQQRDIAVRAGTLAAGFLATPLVTALERSLGLDILQIEPTGDPGTARVTIGDEIAPGLVARFSRQFGRDEYDEATLEYSLFRILRIRATFSDAGALAVRSRFRRIERAGIDLIVFLSF